MPDIKLYCGNTVVLVQSTHINQVGLRTQVFVHTTTSYLTDAKKTYQRKDRIFNKECRRMKDDLSPPPNPPLSLHTNQFQVIKHLVLDLKL